MKIIEISETCMTNATTPLEIGKRGEKNVTIVRFDYSNWIQQFGDGVISLFVKRNRDESAYPVIVQTSDGIASWVVSETDTEVPGVGTIEYVYTIDDQIVKSIVLYTCVIPDIGQPIVDAPDPYETWLDTLQAIGVQVQRNADYVRQVAEDIESGSFYVKIENDILTFTGGTTT